MIKKRKLNYDKEVRSILRGYGEIMRRYERLFAVIDSRLQRLEQNTGRYEKSDSIPLEPIALDYPQPQTTDRTPFSEREFALRETFSIIKEEGNNGITFNELIKKRQEKYHRKLGYTITTKAVAELRRRGYVRVKMFGSRRSYRIYPILNEEKQNRSEEVPSKPSDKSEQGRSLASSGPLTFYSAQSEPPKD